MCLLAAALARKKIVAVANGLDENKRAIEHQGDHPGEHELRGAEHRAGSAGRDIRQNEREGGERGQDSQRGARALDLKSLLVMAHAAGKQAQPDDAVAHDHDRGENGVARQPRLAFDRNHDGDDQRHLDDRHRQRENERAERLADRCATTSAW